MSVRPQAKDKPAAASFQWDDPFLLDEQLTEDERMIRDTARAYAQDKLQPRIIKAYLEEKTDREIFNEMGELGLIGVTLPEEYGCANASYVAYGLVAREIERRVPDLAKIGALIGYRPTRTLEEILDDVIAFSRAGIAAAGKPRRTPAARPTAISRS